MIKEIASMQKDTSDWIRRRPLLDTRPETLRLVVQNEEEELKEAIERGDPIQIRSEMGDVLFARAAAGMNLQEAIDRCKSLKLDPFEIFKETQDKNRINYG